MNLFKILMFFTSDFSYFLIHQQYPKFLSYRFFFFTSLCLQQYCPFRLTAFMCRTAVCYARLLVRKGADKTETLGAVAAVGVVASPAVHLAAVGIAAPSATVIAIVAVARVDIPAPLRNVTAHVIKSVTVCLFLCYRMGFTPTVISIPAYFIQIIAS